MQICGIVISGEGRGADLGFPTANLLLDDTAAMPDEGIYAGTATIKGEEHLTAIHIGPRPTFADDSVTVEAHILDFSEDIYDERVCLTLEDKLRDIEKFDTIEALQEAIKDDCEHVRLLLE